jgi:putative transposase
MALARYAAVATRGWAAESASLRVRLRAENDRLREEVALLREELRLKDARMAAIPAHRRPFYSPPARLEILELKAARGWNLEQTARAFLVTAATVAAWMRRLDDDGPDALVQLRQPVNRFPEFVGYAVQRLKTLCPSMGKVKIAQTLTRAGLHLGASTVGRILAEPPQRPPDFTREQRDSKGRVVTAKRPNHVWHVDLTMVPTLAGMWVPWLPNALTQVWPFCWWVGVAIDHYSRRVMGVAVFYKPPSSEQVRAFLGRAIATAGRAPKYIVCDKGSQFWCAGFKDWCKGRGTRPRFGAIGQHGSIAVVERFIRTLKYEGLAGLMIPLRYAAMRAELTRIIGWYNAHRPHTTLLGKTPDEVYFRLFPANRKPRIEAPAQLAARLSLRNTANLGCRQARRPVHARRDVRRRAEGAADRAIAARRVSATGTTGCLRRAQRPRPHCDAAAID